MSAGTKSGPAMRWKLELTGTSAVNCRELEAAVDEVGWTRLDTRTEHRLGVTRVYIATDPGESPEHILTELAGHMQYRLPNVTRGKPTTWDKIGSRIKATVDARRRYAARRIVIPPGL